MAPRRYRRCVTSPLHGGRPTGVRRTSATLSHRPPVPGDDNALYAGVRAPIVEDRPERPRRRAVARLPAVQHRQGLHDPRARIWEAGLNQHSSADAAVMAAKERMTVQFESFRLRLAEES